MNDLRTCWCLGSADNIFPKMKSGFRSSDGQHRSPMVDWRHARWSSNAGIPIASEISAVIKGTLCLAPFVLFSATIFC